ncbi:MAG: leucine-rich repeat-containing protein kinase family protein [Methylococcaceae bacterium]
MQTIEQLLSGELIGIRHLKLSCGLTHFPSEIIDLADTLESLDLTGNSLSSLPDDFSRLTKLRIIFCSNNDFTELPEVLGRCPELSMVGFKANRISKVSAKAIPIKLRWLILTGNDLDELPEEIGHCAQLQKLMLAGNRLQSLPDSLAQCSRLELLRVAANQLTEFPSWLLSLPRLTWLAYSGNPFCAGFEAEAMHDLLMADIPWSRLELLHVIGEGASGIIHQAKYSVTDAETHGVAVKLFKGAVTSDGLPHSEMAAAMGAGKHPNLIKVYGRVQDHPSGSHGLVMELIDSDFISLAGPPSLESCTRDIYSSTTCFNLSRLLSIAHSMASAAQYLHKLGIMHGDFYAHNILHCGKGRALLGDFGAASFYSNDDLFISEGLERLEVRAFGCLLEELIGRCQAFPEEIKALNVINNLKEACLSDESQNRPLFEEICQLLTELTLTTANNTSH